MALSLAYINEVLNALDCTIVVDEATWPTLIELLKFEGRDLTTLVLGRMRLRHTAGGYDGLVTTVDDLLKENAELRKQVDLLTVPKVESKTATIAELTPQSKKASHG